MRVLIAVSLLFAGCHLALGLEPAGELDSSPAGVACEDAVPCDDTNPCTEDRCTDERCEHVELDGPAPNDVQIEGDCQVAVCRQGALVQDPDEDPFEDGVTCTEDVCTAGVPSNPPVAGGIACETGVCDGTGTCSECFSNAECTAPNTCGGGGVAFTCGCTPDTCLTLELSCGNAPNGCGGALDCDTQATDGNETDVDCGGPTTKCARRCGDSEACSVPSDCASGVCTGNACVGN